METNEPHQEEVEVDPALTILNVREERAVEKELNALAELGKGRGRIITESKDQRAPVGSLERTAQLTELRRKRDLASPK